MKKNIIGASLALGAAIMPNAVVAALFGVEKPLCWTGEIPESIFK